MTGLALLLLGLAQDPPFEKVVRPFLQEHCLRCHGPEKQKGRRAFHQIDGDPAAGPHAETWSRILEMLSLGEMPPPEEPPPEEPQPEARLRRRIADWIRTELIRGGRHAEDKLLLPAYGNVVNHDRLFDPAARDPLEAPPRLWRINPYVYTNVVAELSGLKDLAQPFALQSGQGTFEDFAALVKIDEPTTELLIRNAMQIAALQTATRVKGGAVKAGPRTSREVLALLEAAEEPTDGQIRAAVSGQFQRVLLREPTAPELDRFAAFSRRGIAETGRTRGVRAMLAAVLLTPEALYRTETGAGPPDDRGRVRLGGRELAFAIAYALTDRPPDAALLKAAGEGALVGADGVRAQVRRVLEDPKIEKTRLLRFFREYFGHPGAPDVFKEKSEFPAHEARILVQDTEHLIGWILQRDRDVLRELLTTNRSFVNYAVDPQKKTPRPAHSRTRVHLSYGLPPDWKWTPEQPVELPADERAGILTQPSWLVAQSENFNNHAILRGKWVREKLLGGTVPDLPITVDAKLPDDETVPLRERMNVTRQEYCWQCHRRMNPLGLPFERYDHFGRFRARELGRPVDTTGVVEGSGDPALDGPVGDAVPMIRRLAGSRRVQQVFIRHAFRYWMGRNETLGDGATLQEAERAYVDSGGSMRALIAALLSSESFTHRAAGP